MNESKQRKIGAIISYSTIIINIIIQLAYTPFVIRMLGQSEYGLYSLVSSIISYLNVLDLGFGNAIIVYTAKYHTQGKYEEEKKLHGMFQIIFCIIGLIATILGLILFFNVNTFFQNTMTNIELKKAKIMMLILTFNIAITFPFSIYSSIISAYEKFVYQKIIAILGFILTPLMMIPLLIIGFKSITMTIVLTIVNIFILFSNYLFCKRKLNVKIKYSGFNKIIFFEILNYSIFIFLDIIVDKVNWSIDQFILGAISGTVSVSIYAIATIFHSLFTNLSQCCSNILLPKISKMVAKKVNDDELNKEYIKFGRLQWYVLFLILGGIIIYGKEFIKIWAGPSFEMSYYVTLILIIPLACVITENIAIKITEAKNMHKSKAIITFTSAIFNLCISIPLAKKYGPIGCALGTSISLIICNLIIINIYYYKAIKLDVINFWKNIIKISLPLIPILVIAYYINIKLYTANSLISIAISAFLLSSVYLIVAYLFAFNEYEKSLIKNIFTKLLKINF